MILNIIACFLTLHEQWMTSWRGSIQQPRPKVVTIPSLLKTCNVVSPLLQGAYHQIWGHVFKYCDPVSVLTGACRHRSTCRRNADRVKRLRVTRFMLTHILFANKCNTLYIWHLSHMIAVTIQTIRCN